MNSDLKKYLKEADAVLVSSWGNITYLTNYSGFSKEERECFLLITRKKQYLITDGRYSEAVKEQVSNFDVVDEGASKFIDQNHSNILKNLRIMSLGIEENNLTVSEHRSVKKIVGKTLNIDLSKLRILKQEEEVENIKKACALGDIAFKFIVGKLKTGVSERQIANEIEFFIMGKGAEISFKPIVAFGKNSSVPHHASGQTKLKQNQIVLLDFGVKVNNYCSDMTRTIFFGKATDKFRRIHRTVLEAQQKAIQYINNFYSSSGAEKFSINSNNNLVASGIDKVARDYIASNNYPNIPYSLGHGIGIEVHEAPHLSPNSNDVIKPGMIFSVEPGIYIEGYGGVRIEDLVLVTKKGIELISHANREIIEV